ncbi:MAG TPA: hypothetical protein VK660_04720, partial [Xanthomonadaceae bacterium]|nr:hypothetical protein [Xanthomonadaceae bacterium]
MSILAPFLILFLIGFASAYHRLPLLIWALSSAAGLTVSAWLGASFTTTIILAVLVALVAVPLLVPPLRLRLITQPLLD